MNAPPEFTSATRAGPVPYAGPAIGPGSAEQWAALNEAGHMVAALCGRAGVAEKEPDEAHIRDFPAALADLRGVRRDMAENGIADLMAMMEPGIAALLAIRAAGADPAPSATTLWQEFEAARAAILALLPPDGQTQP